MESTDQSLFTIKLLANDIIYIERQGEQAERNLRVGFERVSELSRQLRKQRKPVYILNHAHGEEVSPKVLVFMLKFDFDKCAVYGTSRQSNNVRDLMVRANGLENKIASFETEKEALAWLAVKPLGRSKY